MSSRTGKSRSSTQRDVGRPNTSRSQSSQQSTSSRSVEVTRMHDVDRRRIGAKNRIVAGTSTTPTATDATDDSETLDPIDPELRDDFHVDLGQDAEEPPRQPPKVGTKGAVKTRIDAWLPRREAHLDELIALEGYPTDIPIEVCTGRQECTEDAIFRCTSCTLGGMRCLECIVSEHASNPFHRIEKHNGCYFDRMPLYDLGLRLQLGHDGKRCPSPLANPRPIIAVTTFGIQHLGLSYCNCAETGANLGRDIQLMRIRLMPVTVDNPRTVFTLDVLELFHELTLQGKTTAYDFYRALERHTDNWSVAPSDRYKEFSHVVRIYRHLMMLKRAGRGHDDLGAAGTKPGELAVECAACPQPGRNLPANWDTAGTTQRWLYTQFMAIDANFRLKLKDRNLADTEIAPGWAYFVEEEHYQDTLNRIVGQEETNTCRSMHNALTAQNARNTKGYKCSGVAAVVCGRHSLVRPVAVADLQKGEKYVTIDYAVLSTLKGALHNDMLFSYDIGCQWNRNHKKRIENFEAGMRIDLSNKVVRYAVPKFHLPAHGLSCQTRYSLNYLPCVGRTYGEGVEQGWSHMNLTATSTREMAPAARHETLNDHWGGWNWQKTVGFGTLLYNGLEKAFWMFSWHKQYFDDFTSRLEASEIPMPINDWLEMIELWNKDQTKPDPYGEPPIEHTMQELRLELANEDAKDAQKGLVSVQKVTTNGFLLTGIEIEDAQDQVGTDVKAARRPDQTVQSKADAQESRNALMRRINQWRKLQDSFMPLAAQLRADTQDIDEEDESVAPVPAEELKLHLPSSLTPSARALPAMSLLASKEARFRVAQCEDSLSSMRRLLRIMADVFAFKTKQMGGEGNKANTRANALYQRFKRRVDFQTRRYQRAHAALLVLDPDGAWKESLLPLLPGDVRSIREGQGDDDDANRAPRQGTLIISWIWRRAPTAGDAVSHDDVRLEWATARARMLRWEEEVELLLEEMRRVIAFLRWKSKWWRDRAALRNVSSSLLRSGLSAYASKQADGYKRLAESFASTWIPLIRRLAIDCSWTSEYEPLPTPVVKPGSLADIFRAKRKSIKNQFTTAPQSASTQSTTLSHTAAMQLNTAPQSASTQSTSSSHTAAARSSVTHPTQPSTSWRPRFTVLRIYPDPNAPAALEEEVVYPGSNDKESTGNRIDDESDGEFDD